MSYSYHDERHRLFTEKGIEVLRRVESNVRSILAGPGAFVAAHAWYGVTRVAATYRPPALDYLVEKGAIVQVMFDRWQVYADPQGDNR